jgi:hypothetical protein
MTALKSVPTADAWDEELTELDNWDIHEDIPTKVSEKELNDWASVEQKTQEERNEQKFVY